MTDESRGRAAARRHRTFGTKRGKEVVWAERVEGSRRHATALVDARIPEPDLKRDKSPLMQNLLKKGMIRPYVNRDARDGYVFETGGLDVTPPPFHVVDAEGRENEDICTFGLPTEHARWVTAAGARPGVNSVMIRDADAIEVDFVRRLREDEEPAAAATSTRQGGGVSR